jgi:protease PrsW
MGVLMIFPAMVAELAVGPVLKSFGLSRMAYIAVDSFIGVALIEELCKLIPVRRAFRDPAFNEVMDGMVYCVAAAAGFATLENILYVMQHGVGVGIMRALLSVPMHVFAGAIMGFFLGLAKFSQGKKTILILTGLTLAVLLHGVFDFCLFTGSVLIALIVVPLIILTWIVVGRLIARSLNLSPFKPEAATVGPALTYAPGATPAKKHATPQGAQQAANQSVREKQPSHAGGAFKTTFGILLLVFAGFMILGTAIGLSDNPKEMLSDPTGYVIVILITLIPGVLLLISAHRGKNRN